MTAGEKTLPLPGSVVNANLKWRDATDGFQYHELGSASDLRLGVKDRVALPACALYMAASGVSEDLTPQLAWEMPIAHGSWRLVREAFNVIVSMIDLRTNLSAPANRLVRISLAAAVKTGPHDERWLTVYCEGLKRLAVADVNYSAGLLERVTARQKSGTVYGPLYVIGINDERV